MNGRKQGFNVYVNAFLVINLVIRFNYFSSIYLPNNNINISHSPLRANNEMHSFFIRNSKIEKEAGCS